MSADLSAVKRKAPGRAVRLPAEMRLDALHRFIAERGFVAVGATARELGVSEMTIRRDLARLVDRNLVIRTHGGAVARATASGGTGEEPSFETRVRENASAKAMIAAAAARISKPGQAVGLDIGTTALLLAQHLCAREGLRVFTSNLRAALLLGDSHNVVYAIGGQVRAGEGSVYGSTAVEQLGRYRLDHAFIGVSGITREGCFDYSVEEAEIKRVLIERAARVILICDSSKFDRTSLVKVCDLAAVHDLVTEAPPPRTLRAALDRARVTVVQAGDAGGPSRLTARTSRVAGRPRGRAPGQDR